MKRRPYIIGILAVGLALTAAVSGPSFSRIVAFAQSSRQYFHEMQTTVGSLNPVERFVYSLVLANSHAPSEKPIAPPAPRT